MPPATRDAQCGPRGILYAEETASHRPPGASPVLPFHSWTNLASQNDYWLHGCSNSPSGPSLPQLLPQLCEANYYHKASTMQPQSDSVPQMDPDWHDNLLLLLLSPFLTKQNKNAHEQAQSGKILADFMAALWSQRRHWLGHYPCEGGGTKSIWRRERRGVAEGPSQVGSGVASGRPWRGTCTEWAVCGWEEASPAITAPMKQKGGWRSKNTGKELSSSSVRSCPANVTLDKSLPGSP